MLPYFFLNKNWAAQKTSVSIKQHFDKFSKQQKADVKKSWKKLGWEGDFATYCSDFEILIFFIKQK